MVEESDLKQWRDAGHVARRTLEGIKGEIVAGKAWDEVAKIREAAIFMASNLWRSSEASYRCTPDPEKSDWLFRSWLRRTDLFLAGASKLYPEVCGVTVSDIEREVRG